MPKLKCLILLGFLCGSLIVPVWAAEVINTGSEVVEARLFKADGAQVIKAINPGQRVSFSDDIVKVKITPRVTLRGDEKVRVKVIHPNGAESLVKTYNDTVIIGQKGTLSQTASTGKTTIKNTSNVVIVIKMFKKTGLSTDRIIYPAQTEVIPPEVLNIELAPSGSIWGDEKPGAEVYTHDGTKTILNGFGSKMSLVKETKTRIIPSFMQKLNAASTEKKTK